MFRKLKFGEVAPHAFAAPDAAKRLRESGSVNMRGLYLLMPHEP